jgi:hypothetical protein
MEKYIYLVAAFIFFIAILWLLTELFYARLRRRSRTGKRALLCYPKTNDVKK